MNTNSGDLIGTDTFVDNQVKLRKGSIYQCAEEGGFGILDEINMAKNDAFLCFTPHWTTAGPLMCQDTINRPSPCGKIYRNYELRVCRNQGAE